MVLYLKRVVTVVLVVTMAISLVLTLPLTALGSGNESSQGVYEGEYDADGKRSGYGSWAFYNYLYVGNWGNDLPGGEGTLYVNEVWENEGQRFFDKTIIRGNWVDGFADGPIEESWFDSTGHIATFCYDVKNGCTISNAPLESVGGNAEITISRDIGVLVAAVPPWSPILADSAIADLCV